MQKESQCEEKPEVVTVDEEKPDTTTIIDCEDSDENQVLSDYPRGKTVIFSLALVAKWKVRFDN